MNKIDILGLIATALTTSCFVPQVVATWRTRDVSGISLWSYVILTAGVGMWLTYGLLKSDGPLILANGVMLALVSAITVMKIRFSA
jgi:MtN3 and saliva related transmembrane protein